MSVLLETSLGDLVLDLDIEKAPKTCENFLKLCKAFKYNYCAFFTVQKNFLAQTGDPSSTGKGGASVWNQLPSTSKDYSRRPYFRPERSELLKHGVKGTVSMALSRPDASHDNLVAGSQFFITLADGLEYLDGKHAPFATVVEGHEEGETLDKINDAFTDDQGRPLRDIRIKHVIVLEDPFPDPEGLQIPSRTPSPTPEQLAAIRLGDAEDIEDDRPEEEKEAARRQADSSAAALTLEMVGDLPFAEIRPPENILFVCKLNPVTRSEDLELIFSRFGKILSCEVIRDKKSGDSLQYAFIEFDERQSAEQAYFKMDSVLIDNQRIRVDFSQSVSKLHSRWIEQRTGRKPPAAGTRASSHGSHRTSTDLTCRTRDQRSHSAHRRSVSPGVDHRTRPAKHDGSERRRYDERRDQDRHRSHRDEYRDGGTSSRSRREDNDRMPEYHRNEKRHREDERSMRSSDRDSRSDRRDAYDRERSHKHEDRDRDRDRDRDHHRSHRRRDDRTSHRGISPPSRRR